jgi:hypothetical protein
MSEGSTNTAAQVQRRRRLFDGPRGKILRAVIVFFQFLLVGPPLGCIGLTLGLLLVYWVDVTIWPITGISLAPYGSSAYLPDQTVTVLSNIPIMLLFGVPASYLLGGIQAAITGLISSVWGLRFNQLPLIISVLAGTLPFLAFSIYSILHSSKPFIVDSEYPWLAKEHMNGLVALVFAHIFASCCCWFNARRNFRHP